MCLKTENRRKLLITLLLIFSPVLLYMFSIIATFVFNSGQLVGSFIRLVESNLCNL